MKLNKIPKNELELLSYTEIAKLYLAENKTTQNTAELFKNVCDLLELPESEYVNNVADFFQSLSTSKEFILLDNGEWDLKSNHKVKVSIDEIYEDTNPENEEEIEEETDDNEEETDDIDLIDNNDTYLDDDTDDDLADLTIISDEEIEE